MADKMTIINDIETMLEDKRRIVHWIHAGSLMDILKLLKESPDVVRCKDCKHYMTIHCTCDGCCISDDWFCADGER